MADTRNTSGISFWRQDINWYVQQQNWTRSFFQQDQDWNQRLSDSNPHSPAAAPNPSAGAADIADQKIVNLVDARAGSPDAPPSGASGASGPGNATDGAALNLLA